eukprot:m.833 g.833  ORF g.833 m.833 type:complete len:60 (+) comp453_c0_seq1:105-284(+)
MHFSLSHTKISPASRLSQSPTCVCPTTATHTTLTVHLPGRARIQGEASTCAARAPCQSS